MATHCSVLAWRIPGTGEPGGLPSMGSHRVRHDWSDLAAVAAGLDWDFSSGSVVKNPPANAGDARDADSVPGSGRSPGIGIGNPLQYSCRENSMDRGTWQTTVYGVARSDSLWPHRLQHTRSPCPLPTPGVHSNSCPSIRQWCHPAISSSVVPFSSCPQSLTASESFPMSQLFIWFLPHLWLQLERFPLF